MGAAAIQRLVGCSDWRLGGGADREGWSWWRPDLGGRRHRARCVGSQLVATLQHARPEKTSGAKTEGGRDGGGDLALQVGGKRDGEAASRRDGVGGGRDGDAAPERDGADDGRRVVEW